MIFSGVDLSHNPWGRRAKAARKWFAENGPPDAQPLPLGYGERESLKHGGVDHILAWYARSLADQNYDVLKHPSFYDYACGVMASPDTHNRVREDEQLRKRFPPCPLDGLDRHLYWKPSQPRAQTRASGGRRSATKKRRKAIAAKGDHRDVIHRKAA